MARGERKDEGRTERIPFGVARKKLNLDDETTKRMKAEGKVVRWINDTKQRIPEAMAGGYEFVNDTNPILTGDAAEKQTQDRRIRKVVGRGKDNSPIYAYLMAIPKKFYDEDQRTKEETNKMVDDAIRAGQPRGLEAHGVKGEQGSTYVKGVDYKP